jgi:TolB-like protein/Tfp pilus assembly protein PilF
MAVFSLTDFLNEARRRRVFGVMALYAAGAFILIQVADLAFPGMGIPDFAIRYVWIGAILGLPVALVFGWRYDMTIQGIRRTPTNLEEPIDLELHTPDIILLSALSLATLAMIFLLAGKIFDNLSSDPEQAYFVDGMHDALIAELARISGLTVISRTSTLRYKGTILAVSEIARELNVAMIVEGSVLRAADDIRIQVQLIGVQPERHLLAKTYDRQLSSVLKLQSDVAQNIAQEIEVELTPQEQSRISKVGDVDPEAYTLWLKGNFYLAQVNEESFRKALSSFEDAIEHDPGYASAYAGMAMAYVTLSSWGGSESLRDNPRLAKKAAERALQLDPSLGEAYLALGNIRNLFDWDWAGAERAFKQGISASPGNTVGRIEYANFLTAMGRFDESIEIGRKTLAYDPLSPAAYNELAAVLHWAGRDEEAMDLFREALDIDPNFGQTHALLSGFEEQRGNIDGALTHMAYLDRSREDLSPTDLGFVGRSYALAGQNDEARALLSQLMERRAREFVPAIAIVYIYLGLGEHDEALRWLEVAYQEHDVSLVWLKELWIYDPLRSDPRFQSILERMDFPKQ